VQRVALNYLKPANRTMGMFIPDAAPDRSVIPEKPDVAALLAGYTGDEARSEGEAFDPTPANIDARTVRTELPGGVKLVMLQKETRGDVVSAMLQLNYGDEQSLMGMARIAPLAAQMLMRGTTSMSRQQIQDELDRRQSRLGIGGGPGGIVANIQTTREHLEAVVGLAIDILREPAFPESEFATLRDQALAGLEFQKSEPQVVVSRAFQRHWTQQFDPRDVRYTPTFEEEIETMSSMSVEDMRRFYSEFVGASDANVVIVGDFDPNGIRQHVANRLDGWRSPKPYTRITNPYPNPKITPISTDFETPDKENAFFMAGMPIKMSDEHADYAALTLGNFILGQGPGSRLFGRIRGREGLSYGVGSQFQAQANEDGARFLVNAIAAPQNAARVEASFRDELATILRDGYSDDEIAAAKVAWTQSRQVGRAQDPQLAAMLLGNLRNDRTMAWDADLEAKVNALTGADIRDAMRRHLDLDEMAFMKGGDFAGME
jgi:zinc protease